MHVLAEIAQRRDGSTGGGAGKAILVDDSPEFLLAKDIPKGLYDLGGRSCAGIDGKIKEALLDAFGQGFATVLVPKLTPVKVLHVGT